MGLMSKIKTIFYDEIDDEDDDTILPKKEVSRKDIVKDEKNEEVKIVKNEVVENVKSDNTFSERDLFRSERTFNFTEFDDDEPVIETPRINALELDKKPNRVETPVREVNTKPKAFKPSPVISPIYGILDKDYVKEEIKEKKKEEKQINSRSESTINYDTIRRKAYGKLEDELEDTMINTPREIINSVNSIEEEVDKLNDKTNKIEDLISRIESSNSSITVGELEETIKDEEYDEPDLEKTVSDDTLEHDLFNLIDSMYDDKED